MDHVHPAGEAELARRGGHELDRGLRERRQELVHAEVREDHPRRALAALLATEDDAKRNTLAGAQVVRRVAALDGHLDFLDVTDQRGGSGLARAEEEPGEEGAQRQRQPNGDEILDARDRYRVTPSRDVRRPH